MLEQLNLGRTCLLAVTALTLSATATNGAEVTDIVTMTFGTNENNKSLAVTNGQVTPDGKVIVRALTGPVSRICNIRDAASMMNEFISAQPDRPTALRNLAAIKLFNPPDNLKAGGWGSFINSVTAPFGRYALIVVSSIDSSQEAVPLNPNASGTGAAAIVVRDCLTIPLFRDWKAQFTRGLSVYYGVSP